MSCCPSVTSSSPQSAQNSGQSGRESDILPGESAECYSARTGNMSGLQDDATANVLEKIANNSIPISASASTNVQFKLSEGSTKTATSWTWIMADGSAVSSNVQLTSSGLLAGTFDSTTHGKSFSVIVTAKDSSGTIIDSKGFSFSPTISDTKTGISLISPLPGAIVNSKFGPRMHPIQQVMKCHTGIDMVYKPKKSGDVVAAADGEVIFAGGDRASGYGLRVQIKHTTATGTHLCTTTYNHLEQLYVTAGQKVAAGQRVALEGTTGSSTGVHLHFEVKLPNGQFTDPEPLITGELTVAASTSPTGDAENTYTTNNNGVLTESDVRAKIAGCPSFGSNYPGASADPSTTLPPMQSSDPFEIAFQVAMLSEVGSWYNSSDSETIAGLIDTSSQRKKVGYVNDSADKGGATKFGVAQNSHPRLTISTIAQAEAKALYYNAYWLAGKCDILPLKTAVAHFDACVNHGVGRGKQFLTAAGQDVDALLSARANFYAEIVAKNPSQAKFANGWNARLNKLRSIIAGL